MPAPKSLSSVAESGDRLATLCALRDVLATTITTAEQARDVAALSGQLTKVMAEIADLAPPAVKRGTPLDELRERRAARGPAAKGPRRAAKPAV